MKIVGTPDILIPKLLKLERDKQYQVEEYHEKRSKSQNAYCWEIIGKIADKISKSKEEVYLSMLKDYGQSAIVSILSSITPGGYFKYFETIGTGLVNEKEFTHYKIFKGSSEYNSYEMAKLIDGIIQEAEQLDIDTMTPQQVASMNIN